MTYVGTKRGLIEFLERNIKEDDVCISTQFMAVAEVHKQGHKATFQFDKGTFADEKGVNVLIRNKNLAIWFGPAKDISAESKKLLTQDKKAVTKKNKKP